MIGRVSMTSNTYEITVSVALSRCMRKMQRSLERKFAALSHGVTPATVHACRTQTRRLRAFLRTFRHAFNPVKLARYEDALRRLSCELAPLRTADVELQVIERLTPELSIPKEDGEGGVLEIAARARLCALTDLKAKMNGGVWLRRLERLRQAGSDPQLIIESQAPMTVMAARVLSRRRRRLRRQFRTLQASAEALHKRRRKIRTLRYALECCAPDYATARAELKQLRLLQDCLGEIHDAWVLQRRLVRQRPHLRANIEIRSRLRGRREDLMHRAQQHQNQLLRIWKDMQRDRIGDSRVAAVA